MRAEYEAWRPGRKALALVAIANGICSEMAAQGYDLTLRQLYYQFVARGHIPNTERSYKNLGNTINKARLAGLLDWDYIEDRTRYLQGLRHSSGPAQIIADSAERLHIDLWQDQSQRVEVWVEKEALISVVQRPATKWDVNFFACRGYVSQSELHSAAMRHLYYEGLDQSVTVIHLGDHDPSGIDMTRDVEDRLAMFGASTTVERIALNRDQIDHYSPPPNPAKITDSRAAEYIANYGPSSWELDALEPSVIDRLVDSKISDLIDDMGAFEQRWGEQREGRELLTTASDRWDEIEALLTEGS